MGKSPAVHVPVLYPLYHYILYTHTHIVVVYEYHMRMTAKAVNTLEFIYTQSCTMPQTRTIVHSRVNHNCTKYDFTHVRIKHNHATTIGYGQRCNCYTRNIGKRTNVQHAHIV